MTTSRAMEFLSEHHRAVLVTRSGESQLQTSPVVASVDEDGRVVISTRATTQKAKNLSKDPRATLCVFTNNFFGPWMQIDGIAQLVSLPDAMESLITLYRSVAGEHPDWEEFKAAMHHEKRVLLRISVDRTGPS